MANSGLRRGGVDLGEDANDTIEYHPQAGAPTSVTKGQAYTPRNPLDKLAPPAAKELPSVFGKVFASGAGRK